MSTVHLHLALTHVPVVGAIIAFLLLGAALVLRKQEVVRASLWLFVFSAIAAAVVYATGEAAEHAVEGLAGVSESIIERHESVALVAMIALGAYGVIALAALLGFRGAIPPAAAWTGLALAIIPIGALLWTANLGGQIRHTEIRAGAVLEAAQRENVQRSGEHDESREHGHDDR